LISFIIDTAANLEAQREGIALILLIDENKIKDMIDAFEIQLQTLGLKILITQRQRTPHMPSLCSSLLMIVFTCC
jgi:hypothetical protein